MGDFERTFGAGANFDAIINGYNREYLQEVGEKKTSSKMAFASFKDAVAWAKSNPGKSIMRAPDGQGFIEK